MKRDIPISSSNLLKQLRLYYRTADKLHEKLDALCELASRLCEDVGDDLLFLQRERDEFMKLKKKRPKSSA